MADFGDGSRLRSELLTDAPRAGEADSRSSLLDGSAASLGAAALKRKLQLRSIQRSPGAGSGGAVQRFVPSGGEVAQTTAALDTLLGANQDPGGIRAALTTAASSLAALQSAVQVVVTTAAVPPAERAPLLEDVGRDVEVLAGLLQEATLASGAGTPALRLRRVLDQHPAVARTVAALRPLLADQKEIDDKILRGKTGGAVPAVGVPTGAQRGLIGGHSPALLNDPAYVADNNTAQANGTTIAAFYKLLRSDGGACAAAIQGHAHPNLLSVVQTAVTAAHQAANAAPPLVAPYPDTLAGPGRVKAEAVFNAKVTRRNHALLSTNVAFGQIAGLAAAVQGVVGPAAAAPGSAAAVKPFLEAMSDLLASAQALMDGAGLVDPTGTATAAANLGAAITAFEANRPVLSTKKISTLAPPGWSDDDILRAGDATAQVPATLIRHRASGNAPASGQRVETKHQRVIQGIAWVVMKDDVLFTTPPPTLTGGKVTSSYPTSAGVIAPDAVHPAQDADGFSTIP